MQRTDNRNAHCLSLCKDDSQAFTVSAPCRHTWYTENARGMHFLSHHRARLGSAKIARDAQAARLGLEAGSFRPIADYDQSSIRKPALDLVHCLNEMRAPFFFDQSSDKENRFPEVCPIFRNIGRKEIGVNPNIVCTELAFWKATLQSSAPQEVRYAHKSRSPIPEPLPMSQVDFPGSRATVRFVGGGHINAMKRNNHWLLNCADKRQSIGAVHGEMSMQ